MWAAGEYGWSRAGLVENKTKELGGVECVCVCQPGSERWNHLTSGVRFWTEISWNFMEQKHFQNGCNWYLVTVTLQQTPQTLFFNWSHQVKNYLFLSIFLILPLFPLHEHVFSSSHSPLGFLRLLVLLFCSVCFPPCSSFCHLDAFIDSSHIYTCQLHFVFVVWAFFPLEQLP